MNGGAKHEAVASRNFFKEQVHAVIPEALARFPAFAAGDAPGYRMTAYPENFRFHAAALQGAAQKTELPEKTAHLVHLRASQINGCGFCVDLHPRIMKKAGETDRRILSVAAWREAPFYTDAERAALALTEALTRIADRVIRVKNGTVIESGVNDAPLPVERIEW